MTAPVPSVRPEVLAAILAIGAHTLTAAEDALLDGATDAEWAAAEAVAQVEHAAALADLRQRWDDLEERAARRYRRWRAGHRSWVREYTSRPVTPTGPTSPGGCM